MIYVLEPFGKLLNVNALFICRIITICGITTGSSIMEERTFLIDANEVAEEIRKVASESITEEDLRQGIEYILRSKVLEKLQVPWGSWRPPRARYEVTLVSGARVDALYGHVIIEYEKPGTLKSKKGFEKAVEQVKRYIRDHAQIEARFPRYFGIVLDGYKIGFVRYRKTIEGFESKGPFDVNQTTTARLIEAIIGLRRKALGAEELLNDFGPKSEIAKQAIKTLYSKLLGTTPRTKVLFEDWRRVFSQVCAYKPEKLRGLEKKYGFEGEVNVEKLLFALHTYYALIMKLLAAEVASLYVAPKLWSYLRALEDAFYQSHQRLRDELKELEEGGIFAKLGIKNFLEADYFAWYLDEWDEQLAKKIADIIKKLSDYDPSAVEIEPERVKDLFKRLYQNLVPKKIRHDLGEYYTPDWLAELVLDEVGWTVKKFNEKAEREGDPLVPLKLRLLDPACGSGTFLVLSISRLKEYIEEHWLDKSVALRYVTRNIVGFDLNPLAVIASRVNYLIALGDLLREKGATSVEIPVYLADSILVGKRETLVGPAYVLKTVAGEFIIPTRIIEKGLLSRVLVILEECIREKYSPNDFKSRLLKDVKIEENDVSSLMKLYRTLLKLEKEGKNRIWTRILKNSFAPLFVGKFDYVVGNPPWINWENLPKDYRDSSLSLWRTVYGLATKTSSMTQLGGSKKDISMLFTYVACDRYLKKNGILGFLITQSVYKSMAAREFRRFRLPISGRGLRVWLVHDMVDLRPFEGAQNRTASIFIKEGEKTTYPIPYILWVKKDRYPIEPWLSLQNVKTKTRIVQLWAKPVDNYDGPWATGTRNFLDISAKVYGKSPYIARSGTYTAGANGIFWVKILQKLPTGEILIENMKDISRKSIKLHRESVKPDLIYPLLRGRDVRKWFAKPSAYIICPHTKQTGMRPINERYMKVNYPRVYAFLNCFKDKLQKRSLHKKWGKDNPFYSLYQIGPYTFAKYKVVWREQAGGLTAAVVEPIKDNWLGKKVVIPDHKLMMIPFDHEDEAHFICAFLNSPIVQAIVKSYIVETQISTHITKFIRIPRFDPKNAIHKKLSELSKKAHKWATLNEKKQIDRIEKQIDKLIAKLYGLADNELEEVKKSMMLLKGERIEEEEREQILKIDPDITLLTPVLYENEPSNIQLIITNPLDKQLTNIKIKAEIPKIKTLEKLIDTIEKEEKITIKIDGLKKGKYRLKIVMDYTVERKSKRIQKELILFVKEKEKKRTVQRSEIDELFGD